MKAAYISIPSGDAGIASTLDVMVRAAREGSRQPSLIAWAQDAVRGVPARDTDREASAIFEAVRGVFRYTRDPVTVELVKTPEVVLRELSERGVVTGDCDDYVTFLISALLAVGIEAEPVVVAENARSTYTHVLVRYLGPRGWVSLDPITNHPAGWAPTWVPRAAAYRGGSLHGIEPRTMGSPAVVRVQPRIDPAVANTAYVARPANASPFPALAGLGCAGCSSDCGTCSGPTDPAARLSKHLANYTDLLWWAGGIYYAAQFIRKRR